MQKRQPPAEASRRPIPPESRSAAGSARTSFLLSPEAVAATEWLIDRVGSPKEAFRTIEQSLLRSLGGLEIDDLLKQLEQQAQPRAAKEARPQRAGELMPDTPLPDTSTRKSFVIRAETLKALNKSARRRKIKRDVLVNYLLINRKNEMEAQNRSLFEKQVQAQKLVHGIMDAWDKKVDKIKQLLGEDDPIYQAFYFEYLTVWDRLVATMDGILETGEPISEPFDANYR